MILLAHESVEAAQQSARELQALGANARKLLAEAVEETGVRRKKLSKAAKDLESAGFLFIRDVGSQWDAEFELSPTLVGEEALDALDES